MIITKICYDCAPGKNEYKVYEGSNTHYGGRVLRKTKKGNILIWLCKKHREKNMKTVYREDIKIVKDLA